jgi:hypothetical protein
MSPPSRRRDAADVALSGANPAGGRYPLSTRIALIKNA